MAFNVVEYREFKEREAEKRAEWSSWEWFWHHSQRKVGKIKTLKLFDDICQRGGHDTQSYVKDSNSYMPLHLEATPEQLVEAMKLYAEEERAKGTEDKYILHPLTFLNSGRFGDYL